MKKALAILLLIIMILSVMLIAPFSVEAAGNSFAAATSYTLGSTMNGSITSTNKIDYYAFTLSSSGLVRLTASSEMSTTYLIYASTNTGSNIYYITSESFSENIHLLSGKYFFVIKPNYSNGVGRYNFSMTFTSANETFRESLDTNNNTFAKANTVNMGTKYYGQIAKNDSIDVYTFTILSSGRIALTASAEMSTHYQIYASTNTSSYIYYKTSESFSESIDLVSGKYYLAIKPNYSNGVGKYNFSMTFKSANETFKESLDTNNNTFAKANTVNMGTKYYGQIAKNDPIDYYSFTVSSSEKTTVTINAEISIYFQIYDSLNTNSHKYSKTTTSTTEALSLGKGIYYLVIRPNYSSGAGNYTFSLTAPVSPSSITLNKSSISLYKGGTATLTATVYPVNATSKTVTWSSSNSSVATVSNGKVTALAPGTVKITARTSNGKTAVCTIKVSVYTPYITNLQNTLYGVKLTWGKVSGAAKYRVFFKSASKWKKLGDTAATSFVHKVAKSGTKYTYTIRCVSFDGKTLTSGYNANGWTTTYIATPAAPVLKNTASGIQVSWKRVAGAANYRIFRKTGNGKWIGIAFSNKAYVDKTAKNGVTYTYTIRCVSADKKSYTSAYNTKGTTLKCKR
ncbi:MAG: Ig domain-containing protein [Ruminococcus sp.]|nr:Ig domain-containing protein [Ruminococcus sp.]